MSSHVCLNFIPACKLLPDHWKIREKNSDVSPLKFTTDLNENKTELLHISQITPNINEHIGHSVSSRLIRESWYERLFNVFCRLSAVNTSDTTGAKFSFIKTWRLLLNGCLKYEACPSVITAKKRDCWNNDVKINLINKNSYIFFLFLFFKRTTFNEIAFEHKHALPSSWYQPEKLHASAGECNETQDQTMERNWTEQHGFSFVIWYLNSTPVFASFTALTPSVLVTKRILSERNLICVSADVNSCLCS